MRFHLATFFFLVLGCSAQRKVESKRLIFSRSFWHLFVRRKVFVSRLIRHSYILAFKFLVYHRITTNFFQNYINSLKNKVMVQVLAFWKQPKKSSEASWKLGKCLKKLSINCEFFFFETHLLHCCEKNTFTWVFSCKKST